jgi:hypothetical protein
MPDGLSTEALAAAAAALQQDDGASAGAGEDQGAGAYEAASSALACSGGDEGIGFGSAAPASVEATLAKAPPVNLDRLSLGDQTPPVTEASLPTCAPELVHSCVSRETGGTTLVAATELTTQAMDQLLEMSLLQVC